MKQATYKIFKFETTPEMTYSEMKSLIKTLKDFSKEDLEKLVEKHFNLVCKSAEKFEKDLWVKSKNTKGNIYLVFNNKTKKFTTR